MPTSTYIPLANLTLSSSAASVTFSSISQAYRDLVLVAEYANGSSGFQGHYLRVNSDSGSNYNSVYMLGNGSTAVTQARTDTEAYLAVNNITVGERRMARFDFMDYSTTDKHKNFLVRSDSSARSSEARIFRWANTAAITTFTIYASVDTMPSGSTFALYGIAA